jgi:hypothetical protein
LDRKEKLGPFMLIPVPWTTVLLFTVQVKVTAEPAVTVVGDTEDDLITGGGGLPLPPAMVKEGPPLYEDCPEVSCMEMMVPHVPLTTYLGTMQIS